MINFNEPEEVVVKVEAPVSANSTINVNVTNVTNNYVTVIGYDTDDMNESYLYGYDDGYQDAIEDFNL